MINSYASVMRRRLLLIGVLTYVLTLLGYLLLTQRPISYQSEALIEVSSGSLAESVIGQTRGYEEPARRMATEVEVLTSRPVAEAAASRLSESGTPLSAGEAADRLEVAARGSSNYISVAATGATPERAQQVTAAFVAAYFEYRRDLQQQEYRGLASQLEQQLEAAETALASLPPEAASGTQAELERGAVLERIQTTTELLEAVRLRSSIETSAVRLQSDASLPEQPSGRLSSPVAVAVSLFCGFFVALFVAFLIELLQDGVRTRDEAERVTGLQGLATIPDTTGGGGSPPLDAEGLGAARNLRLRLQGLSEGHPPRRVMVAALPTDAQSAHRVAHLLVAACVAPGEDVLLVTDQHDSASPPLEELEIGGVVIVRDAEVPGMWRAPLTSQVGRGAGLLDAGAFDRLLEDVGDRFSLVVVTAPVSTDVDVVAVSHFMQAVLLVVDVPRTGGRRLARLAADFTRNGRAADGLVLVVPHRPRFWRSRQRTSPSSRKQSVMMGRPRVPGGLTRSRPALPVHTEGRGDDVLPVGDRRRVRTTEGKPLP